jgi:hypothetical protein
MNNKKIEDKSADKAAKEAAITHAKAESEAANIYII